MMKVKSLISLFIFLPVLTWAQGTRLAIGRIINTIPVDIVTPGVGKVQVAPDLVTAGIPVVLAIGLFDDNWNPVALSHECQVDIVNSEAVPFLSALDTLGVERAIQLPRTIMLNNPMPGAGTFQVYPYRATIYQDEGLGPDVTQYRFVVKDISDPSVLPDTSFPLDSVMPEPFAKHILVLPGESHYPGNYEFSVSGEPPRLGHPWDLSAAINYDFIVYGTDKFGNTVPGMPTNMVYLEKCFGRLYPETPTPADQFPLDEIAKGVSIAKRMFRVVYAGTGRAWLMAKSTASTPSACREFSILGEPPNPENMIVVIPNPIGNGPESGPCAEIVIKKDIGYGGNIRAKIFNQFGALVREFKDDEIDGLRDASKGFWRIEWCGDNDKGYRVANGVYHFCVEIVQVEKAGIFRAKIGVAW